MGHKVFFFLWYIFHSFLKPSSLVRYINDFWYAFWFLCVMSVHYEWQMECFFNLILLEKNHHQCRVHKNGNASFIIMFTLHAVSYIFLRIRKLFWFRYNENSGCLKRRCHRLNNEVPTNIGFENFLTTFFFYKEEFKPRSLGACFHLPVVLSSSDFHSICFVCENIILFS